MRAIAQVLLNCIGILLVANVVPGITYQGGLLDLLLAGLLLGLINLLVKPLATLLSLPLIIVTLGLFFLVINGFMLYLAGIFLHDLTIDGCFPAILGGIVLALFNWLVGGFVKKKAAKS